MEEQNTELIKVLKDLRNLISENESDYCNSKGAIHIMSLGDPRQLIWLVEKSFLMRYPRGNGFRFRKSECRMIAQAIDRSEISLPSFSKESATKSSQKNIRKS